MAHAVAIVGIGGVFPGARDLPGFWQLVESGRDASRDVPDGRWLLSREDAFAPGGPAPDRVYSTRGYFVEDFELDRRGIALDGALLDRLDPVHHLALSAARDAFENGVTEGLDRARVGVVLGNIALPTESSSHLAVETLGSVFQEAVRGHAGVPDEDGTHPLNRYVAGLPAGLVAQALGLGGGTFALDAACASSLYALELAVEELTAGRADAMLAGGVSRPDCLYTQMGFSQLRALSPSGRCSPLDAAADGLVVGEGAGVFLLKRLDDALAAGDHVYAVLRGIGLSNDLHGSLLAPSAEGQMRAMRAAYDEAGWRPSDVDLIECHATGTPVGDAIELESLRTLWADEDSEPARCVIGGVKANVGHLLTGAGAAGLMKVVLALANETLPPTANYTRGNQRVPLEGSPFAVLGRARPWERRDDATPRRAAVSAFGFGGINAHVLLEEWTGTEVAHASTKHAPAPAPAVAIVGMDAHVGPWTTLDAFRERLFGGPDASPVAQETQRGAEHSAWMAASELPPQALSGRRVGALTIPPGRYRIPPAEFPAILPQQLLLLEVARRALLDAGFPLGDARSGAPAALLRTGVFVGMTLDLETTSYYVRWNVLPAARRWAREAGIDPEGPEFEGWVAALRDAFCPALTADRVIGSLGNIPASRVAREFGIGGPSFALSSEDASGATALAVAKRALERGEIDSALVGGVDLAADLRAQVGANAVRPCSPSGISRPFDAAADGTVAGEGAACVVLKRLEDARRDGDRVYAVLAGVGTASGGLTSETLANAAARAHAEAGFASSSVSLRATHGSGAPAEDALELAILRDEADAPESRCAVTSLSSAFGFTGAASGLVSVVGAALALHHEVLPPLAAGGSLIAQAGARYYKPDGPRYWLRDRDEGPRRAAATVLSPDGNCVHALLEGVDDAPALAAPLASPTAALFVIEGDDRAALLAGIDVLERFATDRSDESLHRTARGWWHRTNGASPEAPLAVALVVSSRADLVERLESARQRVRGERSGPGGRVAFSPEPLGRDGEVAFVFPGSGNHFVGMGRELSARFPGVLRDQDARTGHLRSQLVPSRFWNGGGQDGLHDDHSALIFGQVALGTFMSDLVRGFGVRADAAIGYSLGETASLFSLGAWTARDEMFARMIASTLFTEDLCGPCDAAREQWGLAEGTAVDWVLGVVDRPAESVREALPDHDRAYLLIVNTPGQCVIGGERSAVGALVEQLGSSFVPLRGVTSVHCDVVEPVRDAYRDLHLFDVTPPEGVRFYSCGWGRPYDVATEACADSILDQALHGLDFPALIRRAHEDGVRVFVELGPGSSCTTMIRSILAGEPHAAAAVCVPERDEMETLLRALATLITERVPVDLSPLFVDAPPVEEPPRAGSVVVVAGAPAFVIPAPPVVAAPEPARQIAVAPAVAPAPASSSVNPLAQQIAATASATAAAHAAFLRLSSGLTQSVAENARLQEHLVEVLGGRPAAQAAAPVSPVAPTAPAVAREIFMDRDACLEFAVGSIGKVLGPQYAAADAHPTRVRLPDEPLMLVDRIVSVEGEPLQLTKGRVVTEHDVLADDWYLDLGRIPTAIAVESGQADLFLAGYLGIDFHTRGHAVYRLLDAVVTFHDPLPGPGTTIVYDIHIDEFFNQGETVLFRFHFEGSVDGRPVLSMREGCAGFFTQAELDAGAGIVLRTLDTRPEPGKRPGDWREITPMEPATYSAEQLDALRAGDLGACFGPEFAALGLLDPVRLPGGRMRLIDRVTEFDPTGGRFGLGLIRAEADIHPDDWFLTCHFVDDKVMPGTLMYECSLHTLRVFLMRMGWVADQEGIAYEPIPGVAGRLRCRGQVIETTRVAAYEVVIKEIGYGPEPYAIADALMSADGRRVVQMTDMSLRMTGVTREQIEALWAGRGVPSTTARARPTGAPLFDRESILEYAVGKVSAAFGERYRVFDTERVIARLPGPPYAFLDRITAIEGVEPCVLAGGGSVTGEYDVPPDAWYFASSRQTTMPFAVLLEVALQPCGWAAAYMGAAFTSDETLRFRNLGGKGRLHRSVRPDTGTLTTRLEVHEISRSGGMIILRFGLAVTCPDGPVYDGTTYFGFFTDRALADQVGIRDAAIHVPLDAERDRARSFELPHQAPFPDTMWRMVDQVELLVPDGGPAGLGFVRGSTPVDPQAWFFAAHFYQDPVWPGSLGLESLIQVLGTLATERWGPAPGAVFEAVVPATEHAWTYRGQVVPGSERVTVDGWVTAVDEATRTLTADGFLAVDGRIIYEMRGFSLRMCRPDRDQS